ncbi:XRE family transcriptional regulator [Firmicutes bacterium AM29-6AC]|nr:XRE family transcriptional regulator [Firmicutes bacterium AF19-2LB]RHT42445.1 XRE family transcriptional regulator [Firmicutes bacterium AM29-6AC]
MLNYFHIYAILQKKECENMLTLYENIKTRREELGMTKVRLAELVGYDRSMITKIEQGKVDLTQSKISAIAKALQTTTMKLMGDEEGDDTPSNILPLPKTRKIPLLGTIACGEPILATENVAEYVDMDTDIHADFALRCNGDSMINARIFDGDIVYIRKQNSVENGEIAAVLIDSVESESEATLKRFFRENDKIRLSAENPMYADKQYYGEEMNQVRVIGKAVAFLSTVR